MRPNREADNQGGEGEGGGLMSAWGPAGDWTLIIKHRDRETDTDWGGGGGNASVGGTVSVWIGQCQCG